MTAQELNSSYGHLTDSELRLVNGAILQQMMLEGINTYAAERAFKEKVMQLPMDLLKKGLMHFKYPTCLFLIRQEIERREAKAAQLAAKAGKSIKGGVLLMPSNTASLFKIQTRLKGGVSKKTGEVYDEDKGYLAQPVFSRDSEADRERWSKESKKLISSFQFELGHLAFKGFNGYDYTMRQYQRWAKAGNVQQIRLYANQWREPMQTSMGVMMLPVLVFEWNAPITHQ